MGADSEVKSCHNQHPPLSCPIRHRNISKPNSEQLNYDSQIQLLQQGESHELETPKNFVALRGRIVHFPKDQLLVCRDQHDGQSSRF